jgi:hypothetical protein
MVTKYGDYSPVYPAGYELPDYEQRVAEMTARGTPPHNNLQMGNWLAGGRGILNTAGMYPEGYIGYPPIVVMLAEALKLPLLNNDFKMSADDYSTDPNNSNKYKPIV